MEDKNKKLFLDKLYFDPIDSINSNRIKPKGYRIKGDISKETEKIKVFKSLPNVQIKSIQTSKSKSRRPEKPLLGSVIIQNWATIKNVPDDIGDFIHFPVLIDRRKYRYKDIEGEPEFKLPEDVKFKFSKLGTIKRGEKMMKKSNKELEPITITSPNYSSKVTTVRQITTGQTDATEQIKPFSAQMLLI